MTRSKLGLLGLCAVVISVIAISTSVAQASQPTWIALAGQNLELTGENDSADLSLLTELAGIKVTVTCTGVTLKGISLEEEGTLTEGGKVALTGCSLYSGPGVLDGVTECTVKSSGAPVGTVETGELKGELVLHELAGGGKEVLAKIEPKTAEGILVTFRLEECALPENNLVRGVLYLKDGLGQATTHAVKHLVEQGPLTLLYVGAHSAKQLEVTKIDGSVWVSLTGADQGLHWGATE